jgi:RNA polymerase sigma-32 factor
MLAADEEARLFLRHRDGDARATRALVDAHMPLINKIAGTYSGFGSNHADVVQEAALGFLQGLAHFDPDRGFRINTFCRWWSRAAATEWVRNNHSLVKIGTTAAQKKLFGSLRRTMARLGIMGNPTPEQMALLVADFGMDEEVIREMIVRLSSLAEVSADAPIRGNDGSTLTRIDQMADESQSSGMVEDAFDDARRANAMREAIAALDARKRDIIERRYLKDEADTLEVLARTHGVTRERIRQLEVQAIEQLGLAIPGRLSRMAGQDRRTARLH